MKNPVITFSLIALMAMPAMAQEEAATAAATDDGLGLSTGATIVYSNVTGELDKDGKAQEMEDMSISSMIININAEYSLAAAVDGSNAAPRDEDHLVKRGSDQATESNQIRSLIERCLKNGVTRHHHSKVYDLIVVAP